MPKISDLEPSRGRMFLIKGESGSGKTVLEASFPEPIYVFDNDNRIGSLLGLPFTKNRDVEFDQYDNWEKITSKLEQLESRCDFATVCYDGITSGSRATINTLFRNRGISGKNTAKKKGGEESIDLQIGGIPIMGIQDYSGESSGLAMHMMALRVIHNVWHCNIIVTAHIITGEVQQLDGKYKTFRKILTGGNKISAELPIYFDEIYHCYADSDINDNRSKFLVRTRSTGIDFARTAIEDMPSEIDQSNESFYEIWKSYLPKVEVKTPNLEVDQKLIEERMLNQFTDINKL
jgi:hypothetical protein